MKRKLCVVFMAMVVLVGISSVGYSASVPIDQDFGVIDMEWFMLDFEAPDVATTYMATLTDYERPAAFDYLYFYAVSSGDILGEAVATGGSGSASFLVDAGRAFTVAILGNTDDTIQAGLFNFKMSGTPVPIPASLLLLGSGLVALTALKRRHDK